MAVNKKWKRQAKKILGECIKNHKNECKGCNAKKECFQTFGYTGDIPFEHGIRLIEDLCRGINIEEKPICVFNLDLGMKFKLKKDIETIGESKYKKGEIFEVIRLEKFTMELKNSNGTVSCRVWEFINFFKKSK